MIGICTWWFLLGDTRVVCECDLNSLGVGAEKMGRHLVSANHYRDLSVSAFTEWERAVA